MVGILEYRKTKGLPIMDAIGLMDEFQVQADTALILLSRPYQDLDERTRSCVELVQGRIASTQTVVYPHLATLDREYDGYFIAVEYLGRRCFGVSEVVRHLSRL